MKTLHKISFIVSILLLAGCDANPRVARHHLKKEQKAIYHLNDGRYAYRDDNFWYYYMIINMDNGGPSYVYSNSFTPPAGGNWTRAEEDEEPDESEIENEIPASEEISVQESGEPATADMEQMEFDFDTESAESNDSSSESSDSDSGGGDSGGGDGGGGPD